MITATWLALIGHSCILSAFDKSDTGGSCSSVVLRSGERLYGDTFRESFLVNRAPGTRILTISIYTARLSMFFTFLSYSDDQLPLIAARILEDD